jgi:hypothetical protein
MPTPEQFYAAARQGNAFKQKGALYNLVAGHRGQDFNGWNTGTQIPTYKAGTVVSNYWSAALGWVLVLQFPDGKYGGWSHLDEQSPHEVGTRLAYGASVGPLGSTGRLTTGPHSHNTLSSSSRLPGSGAVEDPLPYIRAAIDSASGLFPAGGTTSPLAQKVVDMGTPVVLKIVEGADKGAQFLAGPGIYTHFDTAEKANTNARALGQPNGAPLELNATEAAWVLDGFHIPKEQRIFRGGHTWDWLKDIKFLLGK